MRTLHRQGTESAAAFQCNARRWLAADAAMIPKVERRSQTVLKLLRLRSAKAAGIGYGLAWVAWSPATWVDLLSGLVGVVAVSLIAGWAERRGWL